MGRGRLLVVTSNYPRWAGDSTTPFVLHLCRALAERDWEVDVLAPHAPGAAADERLGGIPVHRFRYLWPEGAETVCYQGGALVNVRRSKANLAKLPALVGAEWAVVRRRLRQGAYDAVHAHWALPQGLVGVLAAGRRVPVVVTVHGGDVFALDQAPMRAAKRHAFRRAAAVTANSSATERAVLDLARPRRLERIPMGIEVDPTVDPELVALVRAEHRRGDGPLLALVGRVVEEKGVFDLLDVVDRLRADLPQVTAVVVGEGQDREQAERRARERGLAGHVRFVGWVDAPDVPAWLAAADVVVAPSRTGPDGWTEGQGLAIVEAMAVRRPVVASDSGGIGDAVVDGETGLLVPEGQPDAMAEAVRRLVDDQVLAERLAEGGRALAVERFSAGASADAFSALFADVVGR